jgi:hypothetical protein
LTGADVGASSSAVGAADRGGSWALDVAAGALESGSPFSADAMATYRGVLDAALPAVRFRLTPGSVLLGGTFQQTIDLGNNAAHAVGADPVLEVFAPSNGTERVSLLGAVAGGTALGFVDVTLQADADGRVYAIDPLLADGNGHALAVAAPTGFQAGDHMYAIRLADASVGAGQSAAAATLTWSIDASSKLTQSGGLRIAAIGAFANGGDAVRGTNPAEGNLASDAGNGLATADANVGLIEASGQVAYALGGDPALGASGLLTLTLRSAPATTLYPIEHLVFDQPPSSGPVGKLVHSWSGHHV